MIQSGRKRFENVAAVEVEIDANGWPHVIIFPQEGNPWILFVQPQGHGQLLEDTSASADKLWSRE